MRHRIEWPKIIGGILALESTGLILWKLEWWWSSASSPGHHVLPIEWFWLAVTVVFSALSYGVYCAHEWARRVVIVLGLFVVAALTVSVAYSAIHEIGRVPEFAQEVTSEARAWQIRSVVMDAGIALCIVAAPLTLLIAALAHPDVARSFRARTTNAT